MHRCLYASNHPPLTSTKPLTIPDTRLADRKSIAPTSTTSDPTSTGSPNRPANDEISRLRHDLTAIQAARSHLSTQLLSSQAQNTSLTTSNTMLTSQLVSVHRQLASLERKLKDRDEELREKKKLVDQVQDDLVALTVEFNAAEREN
jgi:chromosome segregation ATPase